MASLSNGIFAIYDDVNVAYEIKYQIHLDVVALG